MKTRTTKGRRRSKRTLAGTVIGLVLALLVYFLQGGKVSADGGASAAKRRSPAKPRPQKVVPPPAAPAVAPVVAQESVPVEETKPVPPKPAQPRVQESRGRAHWHQGNLQRHWEKHGTEFPECVSAEAYGAAAAALADNPPEGTLRKTTAEGDQMFYHPPTNRFLVMTADGTIKTFFKPSQGINYWRRQ